MRIFIVFLLFLNLSYSLTIDEIYDNLLSNNPVVIDGLNYYFDDYLHDKNTNGYFQPNYYGRSMWVKTDSKISSGVLGFPSDTCGLVVSNVVYETRNNKGEISASFVSDCEGGESTDCYYFSKVELFRCFWNARYDNDNSVTGFLDDKPDIVCKDKEILNPQTGNCVVDCTDKYKNKWGFIDGSCIDCSAMKTSFDVINCYCKGIGSSFSDYITLPDGSKGISLFNSLREKESTSDNVVFDSIPNFYSALCDDDTLFDFFDPKKEGVDKKLDDNIDNSDSSGSTTTNTDTTNPSTDNTKPNTDNGSTGNNSGNVSSGGSSNGGNDSPNGNPNGKPDGKECKSNLYDKEGNCLATGNTDIDINNGDNGKGKDDNGDFNGDTSYYESEQEGFFNTFSEHLTTSLKKIDEFNEGLEGFINQVQKGSFTGRSEKIKNSCPKNFSIDVGFRVVNINTDYCKELSSVSEISYYIFYAFFGVVAFAFLFKLMFLSF